MLCGRICYPLAPDRALSREKRKELSGKGNFILQNMEKIIDGQFGEYRINAGFQNKIEFFEITFKKIRHFYEGPPS